MQCLLIKVLGVCLDRSLLCLRRVTPGLCAVMVDGGTDFALSIGKPAFRQHLAFVSGLYTHIFLLYLMHLRVGSVDDLMDRPRKRIVPQASVGAFLHFFKVKLRLARFVSSVLGHALLHRWRGTGPVARLPAVGGCGDPSAGHPARVAFLWPRKRHSNFGPGHHYVQPPLPRPAADSAGDRAPIFPTPQSKMNNFIIAYFHQPEKL